MKISQLREVLGAVEGHYRRDGNQEVADALAAFTTNLLQEGGEMTVAAFVARVERARKPGRVRSKSTRRKR